MAAHMSHESGLLSAADLKRIVRLIERLGLPTYVEQVPPQSLLEHMRIDKKVLGGRIRLVLLQHIGTAVVTADYDQQLLLRTLEGQPADVS